MTEDLAPYLTGPSKARPANGYISIGKKIGIIFCLVLFFAAVNIVLVKGMLSQTNAIASTVNAAGKLRMLSQKIAYDTMRMSLDPYFFNGRHIEKDIESFDAALLALTQGGIIFGLNIQKLGARQRNRLDEVQSDWLLYRENIQAALSAAPIFLHEPISQKAEQNRTHQQLSVAVTRMLGNTEALIDSIIAEDQNLQEWTVVKMYVLLLLDIAIFLAAYIAVRRQIVMPLRMLSTHCSEIASGNYSVRINHQSSDEMGHLALAFNESTKRISELITKMKRERAQLLRAETTFRGLAEKSMIGVYIVQDDNFQYVNAKMADMFGYENTETLMAINPLDIVPRENRHLVKENINKRLRGELDSVHYERQGLRKNGTTMDIEVFGSRMQLDGRPATIGIMLDVTQRKQAEASARLADHVFRNSSEAIVVTNPAGVIIDVNPAFFTVTGYQLDEVIGKRMNILNSGRQDKSFYQDMWHAINTLGKWQGEIRNRRKNGEEYVQRLTINTSRNEDGSVRCRIGLLSDITEKKFEEESIWKRAHYDHLSGLPNRQMFQDRLKHAMSQAQRSGLPLALIFMDLDYFKEINDTYGHSLGDELLKIVAQRLKRCVRESDTVARLGGDEFTIILGDLTDVGVVDLLCQKILTSIGEPYQFGDDVITISASIGITLYPADGSDMDDLLINADLAMYEAKGGGRNQYRYFVHSMQETAQVKRQLSRDLLNALADNQFFLLYQPIIDLASGVIRKAEALIRWRHPTLGVISPADFIPFAEDNGIINEIGDWVFHEAVHQVAVWRATHAVDFQVTVNVSPIQFQHEGLDHNEWLAYLRDQGLPGDCVVVEITERLLMQTDPAAISKLRAFRNAGIQVALDDFGTGYSSLSYLKKFNLDYIKIDRSFVRNLVSNSDDMALCVAIIAMAHKLGLKVIAEGVGTEVQRDLLLQAGCDYAQGYLFSRPVTAEALFEPLAHKQSVAG